MKNYLKYIFIVALGVMLIFSCKKENLDNSSIDATLMKVYDDTNVKEAIDIVAGVDVVLIVYVNLNREYHLKLIDNEGREIWDKTFEGIIQSQTSNVDELILDIIHENSEVFTFFYGRRLIKINYNGEVVEDIPVFSNLSDQYDFNRIYVNRRGNYIILGKALLGGDRTFIAEFTQFGEEVFRDIFYINVTGINSYTSLIQNEDGGYFIAGLFKRPNASLRNQFILVEYDEEGEKLDQHIYYIDDFVDEGITETNFSSLGSELFRASDGKLILTFNSFSSEVNKKNSLVFSINQEWEVVNTQVLDLASTNFLAGTVSGIGDGMVKNRDGSFTGLVSEKQPDEFFYLQVPMNFESAEYSYIFDLNPNGEIIHKEFIDRNYSNYFNSVCKLSNNKTAFFGTMLSFGKELKLALIIR